MKNLVKGILFCLLAFMVSCKKNASDNDTDTVTTATIHGQVFNQCTDSGLVNCTVFFKQNGSTIYQLNSDANGNFSFANVQVHSSSSYSYAVATIDNSTGGGGLPPLDGDATSINKENLSQMYILKVIPKGLQWFLYFPAGITISGTDTVLLTIQQKIFHQNYPSGNYLVTLCSNPTYSYTSTSNYITDLSLYWMGWWYSTLTKTKNGIPTTKIDSFYVPWNATVTDTIPW